MEDELGVLLCAALDGNDKAYMAFLERVALLLRPFLRSRIGSGADPEDIVQETLLAIHLKRHTWERHTPPMPWVYAIARHKAIDAFRKKSRHVEVELGDLAERVPQPESETASGREIGRALAGLTDGQRAVVGAVSVEGLSIRETAGRLKMSETAVRVTLHRGLAAIAKRFGRA